MRMLHYFTALAVVTLAALGWTVWTALVGDPLHLSAGLFGAVCAVGLHTLLILFMIVTGRVLREAMRSRPLGDEFLVALNEFFARRSAYPAALFGTLTIVATGVLGYGQRAFGLPPAVHMLVGILALVVNLWAITLELRTLRANQDLIDRAAAELDRLDRAGVAPAVEEEPYDPRALARGGLAFALSVWLPWAYWIFIVEKGRWRRLDPHPWIELTLLASLFGVVVWLAARDEARRTEPRRPS